MSGGMGRERLSNKHKMSVVVVVILVLLLSFLIEEILAVEVVLRGLMGF